MKSTHTVHDMTENIAEIWNTIIKLNTHAHITTVEFFFAISFCFDSHAVYKVQFETSLAYFKSLIIILKKQIWTHFEKKYMKEESISLSRCRTTRSWFGIVERGGVFSYCDLET